MEHVWFHNLKAAPDAYVFESYKLALLSALQRSHIQSVFDRSCIKQQRAYWGRQGVKRGNNTGSAVNFQNKMKSQEHEKKKKNKVQGTQGFSDLLYAS